MTKKSRSGSLIWAKNRFASSVVVKKSVQQAPKFGADPFYKPPFSALWATHPYQNER